MENPGSSIISALGGGSGVDFIQLATDISEATFGFQRSTLEGRNETLEARISSASLLRNSLTTLANALGDRVRNGDIAPRASIGDPSVVSASTTPGITPTGTYSLEVTQLAQGQTLVSNSYASASDLVGEGTLNIRFGTVDGVNFTEDTSQAALAITADATDTLQTLAAKITAQSGGALSAYVAQGTDGAQLVFKGSDGAASGFVIEADTGSGNGNGGGGGNGNGNGNGNGGGGGNTPAVGELSFLNWTPATDTGQLRETARDALFKLDTVEMSSASNTVTGLPEGITLTLKATNQGAPTSIAFTNDTAAITSVMQDFTAALNDLAGQLNEEAAARGGTLGNDPGARELKRDLRGLTNITIMPAAAEGEPRTLADLGLKITRDGTFELDAERLAATIAASPDGAAAMFTTGPFGVYATMDNLARENSLASSPGSLGASVARYEDRIERNDDRLARIAEQQESLRARLTRELVAAERSISGSQSTLSFLQQQIDVWNASR